MIDELYPRFHRNVLDIKLSLRRTRNKIWTERVVDESMQTYYAWLCFLWIL